MSKRRASGEGLVRQRESGRWEGRIVVGHKDNGEPIFRYLSADSQKLLLEKMHRLCDEFGGVNYKYTFTYTTDDEKKKDSFNEVLESINIFEAETETNLDKLKGYAIAGAVCALIMVGIIRFIRTPEKRVQGKL